MRRGLLVAALVLVPFFVLVALGFYFQEAPQPPLPLAMTEPPTATVTTKEPKEAKEPAQPLSPALSPLRREREFVPLAAVEPHIRRCLEDHASHGQLTVRFTPQRDGGFGDLAILSNESRSPYLAACVEDVFEEVGFTPSPGPDYEPLTHTF